MVQIARTQLPPNQVFYIALSRIFGIGRTTGLEVAEACGVSKELKVRDVKEQYVQKAAQYIQEHYVVGDALKRTLRENIGAMMKMKSYRGSRHEHGLSISGHTQSNNKTAKKLNHYRLYDTTSCKVTASRLLQSSDTGQQVGSACVMPHVSTALATRAARLHMGAPSAAGTAGRKRVGHVGQAGGGKSIPGQGAIRQVKPTHQRPSQDLKEWGGC